jgi:hypothetical protein
LLDAVTLVEPELSRRWTGHFAALTTPEGPSGPPFYHLHGVALMLCGLAVENFAKAVIAVRLSDTERARVLAGGRLPAVLKTHKLFRLIRTAGIRVSLADEAILARAADAVLWFGRYPIPLNPSDMSVQTTSGGVKWSWSALTLGHAVAAIRVTRDIRSQILQVFPDPAAA